MPNSGAITIILQAPPLKNARGPSFFSVFLQTSKEMLRSISLVGFKSYFNNLYSLSFYLLWEVILLDSWSYSFGLLKKTFGGKPSNKDDFQPISKWQRRINYRNSFVPRLPFLLVRKRSMFDFGDCPIGIAPNFWCGQTNPGYLTAWT